MPRGLTHHLAQAPAALDAAAACRHAAMARLGGDAGDLARLERHPGWALDPTASPDDMIQDWLRSLQTESEFPVEERLARDEAYLCTQWPFAAAWVVRHREALATAGDAGQLVEWLLHAVTEQARTDNPAPLAWAALTPERVRAMMAADRRGATLEAEARRSWRHRGWDLRVCLPC